jgi:hypothetical protein
VIGVKRTNAMPGDSTFEMPFSRSAGIPSTRRRFPCHLWNFR